MSRYVDQNDNLSIHGGNDIHLDVDQKCQVKKKKKSYDKSNFHSLHCDNEGALEKENSIWLYLSL